MKKKIFLSFHVTPLFLHSCAPKVTRAVAYPVFYEEQRPLSIIVMPSFDVDQPVYAGPKKVKKTFKN